MPPSLSFIVSEVASSLRHDITDLNLNRSTLYRTRAKHRAAQSDMLKSEFTVTVPLTAHWDGKLIEDITTSLPESILTVFQLLFQVLEWSSYLVFRNFHPELLRPKLVYCRHHVFGGMGYYESCFDVVFRHYSRKYWPSFWCLYNYRTEAWKNFALLGMSPSYSRVGCWGGIRSDKWCIYWP